MFPGIKRFLTFCVSPLSLALLAVLFAVFGPWDAADGWQSDKFEKSYMLYVAVVFCAILLRSAWLGPNPSPLDYQERKDAEITTIGLIIGCLFLASIAPVGSMMVHDNTGSWQLGLLAAQIYIGLMMALACKVMLITQGA